MSMKTDDKEIKLDYEDSYIEGKGIFNSKTRGKLLGIKTRGREPEEFKNPQYESSFWWSRREAVKGGLKDIELFIKVADEKNLNLVITYDRIKPLVDALLFRSIKKNAEPNENTVKIARMFVRRSFKFLEQINKGIVSQFHQDNIRKALEICDILALFHLPDERKIREKWERPHG